MSDREARRHPRILYAGPLDLSWEDASGPPKFTRAKCTDVSEGGLRLDMLVPVPLRTHVSLRAERLKLSGSATVRRVARSGSKYSVSVELSQPLRNLASAISS